METALSLLLGLVMAALIHAGRYRYAAGVLPWVVLFWLAGFHPWWMVAAGVSSLACALLVATAEKRWPAPGPKPGARGRIVVDVLPKSDKGAVVVKGRLFIAHCDQPLSAGTEVVLEHIHHHHAWVTPTA